MSQENVEIVRSMLATWDADGFDATRGAFHPDVEVVDLGGEWVLAEVRFHGVGRDSGIPVSNRQFEVYRLAGGRIAEIRVGFHDREQALAWLRQREGAYTSRLCDM